MLSVGRISRNRITALYLPIRSIKPLQKSMNCLKSPLPEEVILDVPPLAPAFAILAATLHVPDVPALALALARHPALEDARTPAITPVLVLVLEVAKPIVQEAVPGAALAPAPGHAKPTVPLPAQAAALVAVLAAEESASPAAKEVAATVMAHAETIAQAAQEAANQDVVETPAKEIAHSRVRVVAHFCDLKGPIVWIQLLFSALHRMLKTALPVAIRPSATF